MTTNKKRENNKLTDLHNAIVVVTHGQFRNIADEVVKPIVDAS